MSETPQAGDQPQHNPGVDDENNSQHQNQESAPTPEQETEFAIEQALSELEVHLETIEAMLDAFPDQESFQDTMQVLLSDPNRTLMVNLVKFGAMTRRGEAWVNFTNRQKELNAAKDVLIKKFNEQLQSLGGDELSMEDDPTNSVEARHLENMIGELAELLSNSESNIADFDPRSTFTSQSGENFTSAIEALDKAILDLENIVLSYYDRPNSSISEKRLARATRDGLVAEAKTLVNSLDARAAAIDQQIYSDWESSIGIKSLTDKLGQLGGEDLDGYAIGQLSQLRSKLQQISDIIRDLSSKKTDHPSGKIEELQNEFVDQQSRFATDLQEKFKDRIDLLEEEENELRYNNWVTNFPSNVPDYDEFLVGSYAQKLLEGEKLVGDEAVLNSQTIYDIETMLTELKAKSTAARARGEAAVPNDVDNKKYLDYLDSFDARASFIRESLEAKRDELRGLEKQKKDIGWFREQMAIMEGNFQSFTDGANELRFNTMQEELSRQKGLLTDDEISTIRDEIDARKELTTTYLMVETTGDRLIERLQPTKVDLTAKQLKLLFKDVPNLAEAFREFDRVNMGKVAALPGVNAANFAGNRDRIIQHVANHTDKQAAGLAYRLQIVFMRPSEFDIHQAWTDKDEQRQLFHQHEFRLKYYKKGAQAGPFITLAGYFHYKGQYNPDYPPIIAIPDPDSRPEGDTGWDLFPGFFHACYEGTNVKHPTTGNSIRLPKYRAGGGNTGKIIDFANDPRWKNPDGTLKVEDMPWEDLPQDALRKWIDDMKKTAYPIQQQWFMVRKWDSGPLKRMETYQSMLNSWSYIEYYIVGLRDFSSLDATLADRDPAVARGMEQKKEISRHFRRMWLQGVIYDNFTQPLPGASNWSADELRDVLNMAVLSGFINEDDRELLLSSAQRGKRIVLEMLTTVAEGFQKEMVNIGS